jgi:deoxyribose-phosphate aldolase
MNSRDFPGANAPERRLAHEAADWLEAHHGDSLPAELAGAIGMLTRAIDSTILSPQASPEEIRRLCEDAQRLRFAAVCVSPLHVPLASGLLAGGDVRLATVIGFPSGAHRTSIKAEEARDAVACGADELDMVIAIGMLKVGLDDFIRDDIAAVVRAAAARPVKVILETGALTDSEKVRGARAAVDAGAAFVKTSTGFGPGGATEHDVAILRREAGSAVGVKASGGIRTTVAALRMIAAGADRIGTSSGIALIS